MPESPDDAGGGVAADQLPSIPLGPISGVTTIESRDEERFLLGMYGMFASQRATKSDGLARRDNITNLTSGEVVKGYSPSCGNWWLLLPQIDYQMWIRVNELQEGPKSLVAKKGRVPDLRRFVVTDLVDEKMQRQGRRLQ